MLADVRVPPAPRVGVLLAAALAITIIFWPALSEASQPRVTNRIGHVADFGSATAHDVAVVARTNWASEQSMERWERWQLLAALVVAAAAAARVAFTSETLGDKYRCRATLRCPSSTLARAPPSQDR